MDFKEASKAVLVKGVMKATVFLASTDVDKSKGVDQKNKKN